MTEAAFESELLALVAALQGDLLHSEAMSLVLLISSVSVTISSESVNLSLTSIQVPLHNIHNKTLVLHQFK